MADNIENKIKTLQLQAAELVNSIKKLAAEGGDAQKALKSLADKFNEAIKESIKLSDNINTSLKNEEKLKALKAVNSALGQIISSQKDLTSSIRKSNKEYEDGFKKLLQEEQRLKKLQEEIALKNIQLSEKTNVEKLKDVVKYYDGVQKEYKVDSEEYLKYEKKKLDAQIKLKKASDDERLKKNKARVEQAVKDEKAAQERIAKQQKALRDKIAAGNKARSKKVTDFYASQEKRRADFFARKEKEKTAKLVAEEKKRTKAAQDEAKKRDFGGGFRSQLTPRAIGGALGSLTKYLGLYQAINAAQRLFTELTIGSVKQSVEFEKSLANLGAVAGVSGANLEMLGKNALEVAGATKFTAQEIISLQTELSKLGFSANDVVASTESIAFTAQALGSPLATTAEQIGKVINQFNLLIEQADVVGDVLVTAINNSALSFDGFGTAIQYVGPIARNLGLTFEQTAGAMAVLADNGFTASRIGTGLRGIFTELGKTSADVEASLKDLADQNISLSEAVDLVGKRNAAQLITLLDNIDAIDEANDKYYQQGRALQAAAQQSSTFSGQLDILNSAFREFQIELGRSIAQSDLLLGVLDEFFPSAARTARGFKTINEIGFDSFSSGAEKVAKGADATKVALEKLGITLDEFQRSSEMAGESWFKTWTRFFTGNLTGIEEESVNAFDNAVELTNKVIGLRDKLQEQANQQKENTAITKGQTQAQNEFGDAVKNVTESFAKGINVNDEANKLYDTITGVIKEYNSLIDSGTKSQYNFITGKTDMVELTEEEIKVYKGMVGTLEGYSEQVKNSTISLKALEEEKKKARKDAVREEAKRIKDAIKFADIEYQRQVEQINNTAELQTILQQQILDSEVSTAKERTEAIKKIADIEEKRQQDVSNTYKRKASSLQEINVQYEENKRLIDNALRKAQKHAEILDNDVVSDAANALKKYNDESRNLDKLLKDNIIGQEEYNKRIKANQDSFEVYIKNLIKSNNLGEDAEKILLGMVDAYKQQKVALQENNEMTLENADSFKDFIQLLKDDEEFLKGLLSDILGQAVGSTEEVLNSFNDLALENTVNRLESEIDAIQRRYKIEEDILKASLDNQLISESQYRAKQIELQKAQLAEENSINKKIFEAEKKQDKNDAKIDGLIAITEAYINAFTTYKDPLTAFAIGSIFAGLIGGQTALQTSAIDQRKFFPKKFEDGGVVSGPSHAEGGVPFTVQGRSGYEMEGGEFIVNKRATAMHLDLLKRINGGYNTSAIASTRKFATGGIVNQPLVPNINLINNQEPTRVVIEKEDTESVDYLKAIAEATTSTAIGVSKPVRAYVADKDLRNNATERRLRDRNDKI